MRNAITTMILAIIMLSHVVSATKIIEMPYPYYDWSSGHYYQVVFDGEGEASVVAKIVQLNMGKAPIDNITIEIPGRVNVRYLFQEVSTKTCNDYCSRYDNVCENEETICTNWNDTSKTCGSWEKKCTQYNYACVEYSKNCYDSYSKNFVPLDFSEEQLSSSKKIMIKLSEPIAPGETGTITMYYKSSGYAKKNLNFDFDFETIKSPYDTPSLRVAISVDEDMYLRGGETKTTYIPNFGSLESTTAEKNVPLAGDSANFMRSVSDNVVYADGYVKTKSNLDSWESFHVTGAYNYRNAWFLTYYAEIIVAITVLAAINAFFRQKFAAMLKRSKAPRIIFAGFLSALVVAVSVFVVLAAGGFLSYLFNNTIGGMLVAVAGVITILLSIALPVYYFSNKYGTREGVAVLVSTILWLLIFAYVLSTFAGNYYYALSDAVYKAI
ncbi:MAG: hypothetical protein V1836_02795 [Candidatus Aenigmatarchaeota archaeon]